MLSALLFGSRFDHGRHLTFYNCILHHLRCLDDVGSG